MKTYKIKIEAVKIGSLGKKQNFTKSIEATSFEAAKMSLYDTYEYITVRSVNGKPFDYTSYTPTYK